MSGMAAAINFPRIGSRDAERVRLNVVIDARNGSSRLRAEVLDISATGIRIRTLNPLRMGSTFWVKVPPIEPLEIRVVWVEGFVAGCRFAQPLHRSVFKMVVEAIKPEPSIVDRRAIHRI